MRKIFSGTRCYPAVILIMWMSFLPIWMIGFYNHPSADDFSYSAQIYHAVQSGAGMLEVIKTAIDITIKMMNIWQGIYSSTFLLTLQPAVFGEHWYVLTVFILFFSIYGGTAYFVQTIGRYILNMDEWRCRFLSLLLVFFLVQGISVPVQGLYWYNGGMNYTFFWGLLLIEISLLIRVLLTGKKVYLICACVIGFLLSGGNHITAFANILVNSVIAVYCCMKYKKRVIFLPLLLAGVGFFINLSAPGTKVRMLVDGAEVSVVKTIIKSGYETVCCFNNCMRIPFIILLFILSPILLRCFRSSKIPIHFHISGFLGGCLLGYIVISAMYCVPYYAMGGFGEGRGENIIYFTFYIIAIVLWGYFLGCLDQTGVIDSLCSAFNRTNLRQIYHMTMIIGVVYIAITGSGINSYSTMVTAVKELVNGSAVTYNEEYYARIQIYESEEESCCFSAFSKKPELLFFDDLSEDSDNWKNASVADYYGKTAVRLIAEDK